MSIDRNDPDIGPGIERVKAAEDAKYNSPHAVLRRKNAVTLNSGTIFEAAGFFEPSTLSPERQVELTQARFELIREMVKAAKLNPENYGQDSEYTESGKASIERLKKAHEGSNSYGLTEDARSIITCISQILNERPVPTRSYSK